MATTEELLQKLSVVEKQSYKDIINISIKEYGEKEVTFTMLNNSITKSLNRATALLDGYSTKYKNADVTNSYNVFRGITENISGQVAELDKTNGLINMMVYGDAKTQRELKRYISELSKRGSLLNTQILNDIDTAKTSLSTLLSLIPA